MKRIVAGICIAALAGIGTAALFATKGETPAGKSSGMRSAAAPKSSGSAASAQPGAEPSVAGSAAPAAGNANSSVASRAIPSLPAPSLPPDAAEEAKVLLEINQIILEVTQEAMKRPKTQRMTAEEINQLINSRIEALKAQR